MLRHCACLQEEFTNLKNLAFFQFSDIPLESVHTGYEKCCNFFPVQVFIHRSAQCWTKISRNFSCPLRELTSGMSQIRKKLKNPNDLRILALFSYLENSTCKYSQRTSKVLPLLPSRLCDRSVCKWWSLEPVGGGGGRGRWSSSAQTVKQQKAQTKLGLLLLFDRKVT